MNEYVYAIHRNRIYICVGGYYGNEHNILAFDSRESARQYIKTHGLAKYSIEKFRIK